VPERRKARIVVEDAQEQVLVLHTSHAQRLDVIESNDDGKCASNAATPLLAITIGGNKGLDGIECPTRCRSCARRAHSLRASEQRRMPGLLGSFGAARSSSAPCAGLNNAGLRRRLQASHDFHVSVTDKRSRLGIDSPSPPRCRVLAPRNLANRHRFDASFWDA